MADQDGYKYLARWRGSNYKQLFYKDRKIRAEILYRATLDPEARTPEEVAHDYDVPVEAIHYCTHNEPLLREERDRDLADIRARGLDKPPYVPPWYKPEE